MEKVLDNRVNLTLIIYQKNCGMRTAIVINKITGQEGHIFHFNDDELIHDKVYRSRFKGNGGAHFCSPLKGSQLEIKMIVGKNNG